MTPTETRPPWAGTRSERTHVWCAQHGTSAWSAKHSTWFLSAPRWHQWRAHGKVLLLLGPYCCYPSNSVCKSGGLVPSLCVRPNKETQKASLSSTCGFLLSFHADPSLTSICTSSYCTLDLHHGSSTGCKEIVCPRSANPSFLFL